MSKNLNYITGALGIGTLVIIVSVTLVILNKIPDSQRYTACRSVISEGKRMYIPNLQKEVLIKHVAAHYVAEREEYDCWFSFIYTDSIGVLHTSSLYLSQSGLNKAPSFQ